MSAPISIAGQLVRLSGLVDTKDLNDWENTFVKSVLEQSDQGRQTTRLSGKQVERIDELFSKHFA